MNNRSKYIKREGWISIVANIILFGLKYWAGIVSGSIALIADAWHTLTDSFSSIIVLISSKISRKPADDEHPFGHGRAEHIAAIIIGVLLAIVAFDFIVNSVKKFNTHATTNFGTIAWVATIISVVSKELMAQYALWGYRKTNSPVLKADGWHHRTDALSSIVVLVGIALGKYLWFTDALLGFMVAILIGWTSYQILSKETKALLGKRPSDELLKKIKKTIQKHFNLPLYIHHIHLHDYGQHTEMVCHIKLPGQMQLEEVHEICTQIEKIVQKEFEYTTTIHPEPLDF